MTAIPVSLDQVQAIQGASGGPIAVAECPVPTGKGTRLRPVRLWYSGNCGFGPTTRSVKRGFVPECQGEQNVVALTAECPPPSAPSDEDEVNAISRGVQRGLKHAPLVVVEPAPWVEPSYRGVRYPISEVVCLSTFGSTDPRSISVQNALASYLTTTNYPITYVTVVAGQASVIFYWQAYDSWTGDELVVECQDQEILYLTQWTVSVNGSLKCGPFSLIGGRFPVNLQVRKNETVAVSAILAPNDAFAVGIGILLNGWLHPSSSQTDGTYNKVLRASPGWPRTET